MGSGPAGPPPGKIAVDRPAVGSPAGRVGYLDVMSNRPAAGRRRHGEDLVGVGSAQVAAVGSTVRANLNFAIAGGPAG